MNKIIYRQGDAKWGGLPYHTARNVKQAGCGLCSVVHCVIEQDRYKAYTPKDLHTYMRQYSVDGGGTYYSGISAGLKYYGMEDVREHASILDLFPLLDKEKRVGVLLFNSKKGPDGTVWTTSGHYIAFTDYKKVNGKHYLYLKDSGTRKHDGWYIYESSIKGCLKVAVWSCRVPGAAPEKTLAERVENVTTKVEEALKKAEETGMLSYEEYKNYVKRYDAERKKEPASEYAVNALDWAVKEGLMQGDESGNLMPKAPVSRQDFAVVLKRLVDAQSDDRR